MARRAPFKLKTDGSAADAARCAASRCREASEYIDASNRRWPARVGLCERHWRIASDWEENHVDDSDDQKNG